MNIILCGFMGTGKTSVGRELSRRLDRPFVDTDDEIVAREKRPIPLIFKESGEEYFRQVESEVIDSLSLRDGAIIATGGGALTVPRNLTALRKNGVLVRLDCDPTVLLKRTMAEGGTRPLLNVDEPLREIRKLLRKRSRAYGAADISVDTSYLTVGEAAGEIIERLGADADGIRVPLGDRSYEIDIRSGLLDSVGARILPLRPSRVALVTNTTVDSLYGDRVESSLRNAGFRPLRLVLPDGEEYKDFFWVYKVLGDLLGAGLDRQSVLVALGGGVIGDLTAFSASVFMRGIRCVQVPTTLLAQVDSSVGGKTGVNHPAGKNMIGTFHQPSLVVIDPDTLATLPDAEFRAGLAEVIKYGVIRDREFFDYLEESRERILGRDDDALKHIIARSCEIKAEVVGRDEREGGLRAILNYGHTVAHALETATGYTQYLHGTAVGIGMVCAAEFAVSMKKLRRKDAGRIRRLVSDYGLPTAVPAECDPGELVRLMAVDKKNVGGSLTMILPTEIGDVSIVRDVSAGRVRGVLGRLRSG